MNETKFYNLKLKNQDVEFLNSVLLIISGKNAFISYYGDIIVNKIGVTALPLPVTFPRDIDGHRLTASVTVIKSEEELYSNYSSGPEYAAIEKNNLMISTKIDGNQFFTLMGSFIIN